MATNPYSSQSTSGYNSSPPSDDGSATEANRVYWATIKTKLADVLKTFAEAIDSAVLAAFAKVINTDANENNAMAGSLAFTASTLTISSGSVTATRSNHVIAAESGTADTLTAIATGSVSTNCFLQIKADTGDTITITDSAGGAGEIHLRSGVDAVLSGDARMLLETDGTDWYEISRTGTEEHLLYQDQATSGTAGPTYTADGWRTVTLDTEVKDTGGIGSLSSNQVTIPKGEYEFSAAVPLGVNVVATNSARLRLYDATGAAVLVQGPNVQAGYVDGAAKGMLATCEGSFTLTTSSAVELQIYPTETPVGMSAMTTGEVEVYAILKIRRYAL